MALDPDRVTQIIGGLRMLKFFPDDPTVIVSLTRMAGRMASSEEEIEWLVDRMTISGLYSEWPGPGEMRACFCSKFRPKDGISATSSVYPDGLPSERAAEPILPMLPPGRAVTADRRLDDAVKDLAGKKTMPAGPGKKAR